LICFSLKSAKQHSRLSHDALVGVKLEMKAPMPSEPAAHALGPMHRVVVEDQVHVEADRYAGLDRLDELKQLLAATPPITLAITSPVATSSAAKRDVVPCRR